MINFNFNLSCKDQSKKHAVQFDYLPEGKTDQKERVKENVKVTDVTVDKDGKVHINRASVLTAFKEAKKGDKYIEALSEDKIDILDISSEENASAGLSTTQKVIYWFGIPAIVGVVAAVAAHFGTKKYIAASVDPVANM